MYAADSIYGPSVLRTNLAARKRNIRLGGAAKAYLLTAIVTLCIGVVAPATPTKLLGMALLVLAVLAKSPTFIPGMFVLFLIHSLEVLLGNELEISPFAIHIMAGPLVAFRIVKALATPHEREVMLAHRSGALLVCWFLSLGFAVAASHLGYASNTVNWTRATRSVLVVGTFFLGRLWAPYAGQALAAFRTIRFLSVPVLLLTVTGVLPSHLAFLATGFVAASASRILFPCPVRYKLVYLAHAALTIYTAIHGSFNMAIITTMGVGLVVLSTPSAESGPRRKILVLGGALCVTVLALSLFIGKRGNMTGADFSPFGDAKAGIAAKVEAKLFADRGVIWQAAMEQIIDGPYIVVASGRPLYLELGGIWFEWSSGTHNTILEAIRIIGVPGGVLLLVLAFTIAMDGFRLLSSCPHYELRLFVSGVLATTCTGMAFGDFPIDSIVGFWLWLFLGLATGIHRRHMNQLARRPRT